VPKNVTPRPKTAMEWFLAKFDFIGDEKLRTELAQAFYQARFMGRIIESLSLQGEFNNGFIKAQIVLYASIYEAVIDYGLEQNPQLDQVKSFKSDMVLREHKTAFCKNIKLINNDGNDSHELVPCKVTWRERKLKEIQFAQRLQAAIDVGMVKLESKEMIQKLYDNRNAIHLSAAVAKQFKPSSTESQQAFMELFFFIEAAKYWLSTQQASS